MQMIPPAPERTFRIFRDATQAVHFVQKNKCKVISARVTNYDGKVCVSVNFYGKVRSGRVHCERVKRYRVLPDGTRALIS